MNVNKNIVTAVRIIGLAATVLGSIAANWVADKEMKAEVANKVSEALADIKKIES